MKTRLMMIAVACSLGLALASCHGERSASRDGGVFSPLALYDSNNNQYLVLYQRRPFGDDKPRSIYGQRLDGNGSLNGTEIAVSGELSHRSRSCYAAGYDSQNQRFLVAWPASDHVYGQLVNADGSLFGAAFTIADTASCPVLAYDGLNATFLVSWADRTSTIGVFSQVLNADGTLGGARTLLSNNLYLYSRDDGPVSAAFDVDTGQFLVVMRDSQTLSAQAVKSDGTPAGAAAALSYSVDHRDRAVTLYDGVNKRYLVTWADHDRLRGQFMNPDGTLQGASFAMSGDIDSLRHHALAFDAADQRYVEVYDSLKCEDHQVYGQMLNADGTLLTSAPGSQFLVSSNDYPGANRPSVVFNSTDRKFLTVWEFDGPDARYPDIHGRIINADGAMNAGIFVAAVGGK